MGLSVSECAEACSTNAPMSSDDFCVAFNHYELTFMADIDLEGTYARGWYGPLEDHDSYSSMEANKQPVADADAAYSFSFFDDYSFFGYSFFSYSYSFFGYSFFSYSFFSYSYSLTEEYYYSESDAGDGEIYVYPVCLLLKEIEHVYQYNCDYGEEWKTCTDYPAAWHEDGYPSYNCEWYAYNLDYCHREYYVGWDGEYAHSACCACGGGAESSSIDESADSSSTSVLSATNSTQETTPANATNVEPAFLSKHRQLIKREELRERLEKKEKHHHKKGEKISPFTNDLPLPLVQNKCMTRMSWASAGHQDTPQDTIDRCFGEQMEGTEIDVLHTAADSD